MSLVYQELIILPSYYHYSLGHNETVSVWAGTSCTLFNWFINASWHIYIYIYIYTYKLHGQYREILTISNQQWDRGTDKRRDCCKFRIIPDLGMLRILSKSTRRTYQNGEHHTPEMYIRFPSRDPKNFTSNTFDSNVIQAGLGNIFYTCRLLI